MNHTGSYKNKKSQRMLYQKYKQPAIKSWIQKLAIMHHLKRTTPEWQIHTKLQKTVKINEMEWQQNGKNAINCIKNT